MNFLRREAEKKTHQLFYIYIFCEHFSEEIHKQIIEMSRCPDLTNFQRKSVLPNQRERVRE